MNYFQSKQEPVASYPTKYDNCTLRATGKPYRFQKGSGRSEILNNWARDGMLISELIELAAAGGFDPTFTMGAVFRQHDTLNCAWIIVPPEGTTLEQIRGERAPRVASEEQKAKKAERDAQREARQAEKEMKRAKLDEDRKERERKKAEALEERARLRAEAAIAKPSDPSDTTGTEAVARKGRRGTKPKAAEEGEGAQESQAA